jgi:hypothetical protein
MNSKIKLKTSKTGTIVELTFEHAQRILRADRNQDFEIADNTKFEFINNDLIKKPSTKGSRKSTKQRSSTKGKEVSE